MPFDEHGHIRVTPRELERQAFSDPDGLINHQLLPGTPWGFPTYEKYARFIDYLTSQTGIHPHNFLFRGSTKIGFSISPNRKTRKVWRRFGPRSDLDLAIIDTHFFTTFDEQVRRYDRRPENLATILRYRTGIKSDQYEARIEQKGRHDCYRFFDLPRGLACLAELVGVLKSAPIADCCVHPFIGFRAFIFRDRWAVHRRYHTDLDDLRRGLTTKNDPLPHAGDEPLRAESVL